MAKVTTIARSVAHRAPPRGAPRFAPVLLCLLASAVLVSCGNRGDLYLPSTRDAAAEQVGVVDERIDALEVVDEVPDSDDEDEDEDDDEAMKMR